MHSVFEILHYIFYNNKVDQITALISSFDFIYGIVCSSCKRIKTVPEQWGVKESCGSDQITII